VQLDIMPAMPTSSQAHIVKAATEVMKVAAAHGK
jgi:hypothetical protein